MQLMQKERFRPQRFKAEYIAEFLREYDNLANGFGSVSFDDNLLAIADELNMLFMEDGLVSDTKLKPYIKKLTQQNPDLASFVMQVAHGNMSTARRLENTIRCFY